MTGMIDRVAEALRKADDGINNYYKMARFAIMVMREPTPEILHAHHVVPDDNDFMERVHRNWQAMIDAILAEKDDDIG